MAVCFCDETPKEIAYMSLAIWPKFAHGGMNSLISNPVLRAETGDRQEIDIITLEALIERTEGFYRL